MTNKAISVKNAICSLPSLLFLALLYMCISCENTGGREKKNSIAPAYRDYVSAFTSGSVSKASDIKVRFAVPIKGKEAGMEESEKLFACKPELKGRTYWQDEYTLVFDPEEYMVSGQKLEVDVFLSKILALPKELRTLSFSLAVVPQHFDITLTGIATDDDASSNTCKVFGELRTADVVEAKQLTDLLKVRIKGGKDLEDVTWKRDEESQVWVFTITGVPREGEANSLKIKYDGKVIGAKGKGTLISSIPAHASFELFHARKEDVPRQAIRLNFSEPLDPKQDLGGVIYIKAASNAVEIVKNGNEVIVYLTKRLTGDYELVISSTLRGANGQTLAKDITKKFHFSTKKPKVEWLDNTTILPKSNGLSLPFRAVSLRGVNVKILKVFENNVGHFLQDNDLNENNRLRKFARLVYKGSVPLIADGMVDLTDWNVYALDLSSMIETEPGAIYRIIIDFDPSQSIYPCGEAIPFEEEQFESLEDDPEYQLYDEPGYYNNYNYDPDYSWSDRSNPCKRSYYMRGNCEISKNILASDFGMIAKQGKDKRLHVTVTDILSAKPLAGVKLVLHNYQNQAIEEVETNADGFASFSTSKKGFYVLAKQGKQRGYISVADKKILSMSMFDVGGISNEEGLKGYIYGERGVWRPGDSIFVNFILEDKQKILPENYPVIFELYRPNNQLYETKVNPTGLNGVYAFHTVTHPDDETGEWLVKVRVGGSIFSKYLKIETVKPNRFKIAFDFGKEVLSARSSIHGKLTVKWLHGAVASKVDTKIELALRQGKTTFKDFGGFIFDNPAEVFSPDNSEIYNGKTDEKGEIIFDRELSTIRNAPGMLTGIFRTEAFEEGGGSSVDVYNIKMSPYESYVGLKMPEGKGWNGALYSDEVNLIPIVNVDEEGKALSGKRVKIEVFRLGWYWWWHRSSSEELADYINGRNIDLMFSDYATTGKGVLNYELDLGRKTYGRKFIRITDLESGHSTGQVFYTSYKSWGEDQSNDSPGGAEILSFNLDKKKYEVGETAQVVLPKGKEGRALVSLESGTSVLRQFWVDLSKGNTFELKISKEMCPNVYLHVSLIQPYVRDNDEPIRLYGIQPVFVEDPKGKLNPVITMDNTLKPKQDVKITIAEKQGRPMTYTIAVVDEGLLDLTRFQTPNAWNSFNQREAHGVYTWDLYEYIMGAYTGELSGVLGIGGGDVVSNNDDNKTAQRFKPVVKFMGPFELKSGKATHTFTMPNYVGSVRTMVVAAHEGAYGAAEKTTPVKEDLMILGTLPRVLGPTEQVQLPVTVFAMSDKVKDVELSVETNDLFKLQGAKVKKVSFDKPGEQVVFFDLLVDSAVGIGQVKVHARSANMKVDYPVEIDIRHPNLPVSRYEEFMVKAGESLKESYTAFGLRGSNKAMLEVSNLPSLNLNQRLEYLICYPHGCVEQTTSSVFPQLYLKYFIELDREKGEQVAANIKSGIERLKLFQISSGGLTYWPNSEWDRSASEWGTCYAGHFLIEAQAAGYSVPIEMMKNWARYQRDIANKWGKWSENNGDNFSNSGSLTQAYRLYTLALAGKPELGAMNRMRELKGLPLMAQWRLAAAYAQIGRTKVAESIISSLSVEVKSYREMSGSFGSDVRDIAMILETLVLLKDWTKSKQVLERLAKKLNSKEWMSTQTTAYSLLAAGKYIQGIKASGDLAFSFTCNGKKQEEIKTDKTFFERELTYLEERGQLVLKNQSSGPLFVKILQYGVPMIGKEEKVSKNLLLDIKYTDMKGQKLDIKRLVQGTQFKATVKVRNPGLQGDYEEMILNQVFPSGWEIRNVRLEGMSLSRSKVWNNFKYQDFRDDRVYTYFDIGASEEISFEVFLTANYGGRFYLPAVSCEAMYDNEITAQEPGQWVEVYLNE